MPLNDDSDPEGWNDDPSDSRTFPSRKPRGPLPYIGAALVGCLCVLEFLSFLIGGYQFGSVSWDPHSFMGFTGIVLGSKIFYAGAGATLDVHYELTVRRGTYSIWIKKLEPGLTGPVLRRLNLNNSVTSDLSVPISQSGFYMLHTDGSAITGAYDISHTISWHIRY